MLEFYNAIVACAIHWYNCKEKESNRSQGPINNHSPLQGNDSDKTIEQGTLSSNGDANGEGAEGSSNTPTDSGQDEQERKVTFGDEKAVAITDREEETTSDNTEWDSAKEKGMYSLVIIEGYNICNHY